MPIVDGVLAVAGESRHRLNQRARPPNLDPVGVDHHINLHPDQLAGNRIRIAADLNRAAAVDLDSAKTMPMIELARRQFAEAGLLLLELLRSARVPLVDQLIEKPLVFFPAGEVSAAPQ